MDDAALDAELRRLHGRADAAARLSALHEAAAERQETPEAARFHITQAWVFALVDGDEGRVAALAARLSALGGL